jgi:hypothetical protein
MRLGRIEEERQVGGMLDLVSYHTGGLEDVALGRQLLQSLEVGVVDEEGGEVHRFQLTPGFWHKCPEFRDSGRPVIRERLARRGLDAWPVGRPPRLELVPLGGNRFRVEA